MECCGEIKVNIGDDLNKRLEGMEGVNGSISAPMDRRWGGWGKVEKAESQGRKNKQGTGIRNPETRKVEAYWVG